MGTRSTEADLAAEARRSTHLQHRTFNQEHVPARSVGLITAEMSEAFRPAGGRASGVDPVAVLSTVAAVDDIIDRTRLSQS